MSLLATYVAYLQRFRFLIVIFWIAAFATSGVFVFDFIANTKLAFRPPHGTKTQIAQDARVAAFPYNADQADLSLFAFISDKALSPSDNDSSDGRGGGIITTTTTAAAVVVPLCSLSPNTGGNNNSNNNASAKRVPAISIVDIPSVEIFADLIWAKAVSLNSGATAANFYIFSGLGAHKVADSFLSPRRNMLLLPVIAPFSFGGPPARAYAKQLRDYGDSIADSVLKNATLNAELGGKLLGWDAEYAACLSAQLSSGATGVPMMEHDMVVSSQNSLAKMDAITIPVAMLVMGFTVQSLRLLLIPLLCIGGTLLVSFGLMYPVSKTVDVATAAPSLMMSITISMSTDYCMFILSRFAEEVRGGQRGTAAIYNTLATAGHTILISGVTLCVSFIALIFFPTDLLRSFGIGCSITVAVALLLSLNLTPCLLLIFGGFFESGAFPTELPECLPRWCIWEYFGFIVPSSSSSSGLLVEGSLPDGRTRQSQQQQQQHRTPSRPGSIARADSAVPTLNAMDGFTTTSVPGTPQQQPVRGLGGQVISDAAGAGGAQSVGNSFTHNKARHGGGGNNKGLALSSSPQCNTTAEDLISGTEKQQSLQHNTPGPRKPNNNNNNTGRLDDQNYGTTTTVAKQTLSSGSITIGGACESFDPNINPVPSSPILDTPNWTQAITKERTAQYGQAVGDSVFFRLQPIMRWPWNFVTVLILSAIIGYVGSLVWQMKITDNMDAFLSRGSKSRNDLLLVRKEFGAGSIFPYQLLFVLKTEEEGAGIDTDLVSNESALAVSQFVIEAVANETGSPLSAFQGPMVVGGSFPSLEAIRNCTRDAVITVMPSPNQKQQQQQHQHQQQQRQRDKGEAESSSTTTTKTAATTTTTTTTQEPPQNTTVIVLPPWLSPYCDKNIFTMLSNQSLNPSHTAALVNFVSITDPTGNEGNGFYKKILSAVQRRPAVTSSSSAAMQAIVNQNLLTVYVLGVGPMSEDVMTDTYAHFVPLAIAVVIAVVILCGVAFRSIIVPLRTLLSIAYTELFVFGFTTAVYQFGIFSFMSDPHVASEGAISWLSPVVASLVIVGLATDFDVLIMTRIVEFVSHEGVTTAEGTLLGLCATGKIVTSCGLIMAVAFAGLVLTDMTLINELGFLLCSAALFDTFIVRTMLVPATISLLGRYHWWPSNIEAASFSHIFGPNDSISARASLVRNSMADHHHQQQQRQLFYGGEDGGGGGGAAHGTSQLYQHVEARGQLNKSNQLLEQQRQRLQHLFGE